MQLVPLSHGGVVAPSKGAMAPLEFVVSLRTPSPVHAELHSGRVLGEAPAAVSVHFFIRPRGPGWGADLQLGVVTGLCRMRASRRRRRWLKMAPGSFDFLGSKQNYPRYRQRESSRAAQRLTALAQSVACSVTHA